MAGVVAAESAPKKPLGSALSLWEDFKVEPTPVGERRPVLLAPTATLDQLSCHVTNVKAGDAPHPPHQHPEEELVIVKEGTLEVMQNGQTSTAETGAVIFEASNERHGLKNIGDEPATYDVIEFWPPGMLMPAASQAN